MVYWYLVVHRGAYTAVREVKRDSWNHASYTSRMILFSEIVWC